MKLQTLSAACAAVVTLAFAGGALAAESVTAKLAAPVAEKTKFIAGGAIFLCEGDTCVASAPSSQTFAAATCKSVAKTVGAIASFGTGSRTLDANKLGACNAVAASPTQLANR